MKSPCSAVWRPGAMQFDFFNGKERKMKKKLLGVFAGLVMSAWVSGAALAAEGPDAFKAAMATMRGELGAK